MFRHLQGEVVEKSSGSGEATLVARWHMLSDGAAWSWVRATGYGNQGANQLWGIARVLFDQLGI
ncbi:MAG: hypothetical protein IMF16_00135 [Proteobacteria bacterium]|nr:hypothetical protein [Pseudomonadota bacterium]